LTILDAGDLSKVIEVSGRREDRFLPACREIIASNE
jgi:hypothetical protein